MNPVYSSGAAFYNESGEGKVYVSSRDEVTNLNSELLQGKHAVDFLRVGARYGVSQDENTPKVIGFTGVTHNKTDVIENDINGIKTKTGVTETESSCVHILDAASTIKIGNLVIKSSNGGNGLLIGLE